MLYGERNMVLSVVE